MWLKKSRIVACVKRQVSSTYGHRQSRRWARVLPFVPNERLVLPAVNMFTQVEGLAGSPPAPLESRASPRFTRRMADPEHCKLCGRHARYLCTCHNDSHAARNTSSADKTKHLYVQARTSRRRADGVGAVDVGEAHYEGVHAASRARASPR